MALLLQVLAWLILSTTFGLGRVYVIDRFQSSREYEQRVREWNHKAFFRKGYPSSNRQAYYIAWFFAWPVLVPWTLVLGCILAVIWTSLLPLKLSTKLKKPRRDLDAVSG